MSLPARQERILNGIESALRTCEPRLASRFAIFTWLTRDEELPRTEQLAPRPWLPRRWLSHAVQAGRGLFHRSRSADGSQARAPGRPSARLQRLVLVPVVLIAIASALVVASLSPAHTCTAVPGRVGVAPIRWGTCAASGAAAPGRGPSRVSLPPHAGH